MGSQSPTSSPAQSNSSGTPSTSSTNPASRPAAGIAGGPSVVTGSNPGQGPIINGIQFPAQNNYFFTPTGTNSAQATGQAAAQAQANYGTQQNPITWYVYQDPQGKYSFADVTHQIPGTHAITELPGFGYGQVTINGQLVDFQTAAQTVHTWSPEYQVELAQNYVNSQPVAAPVYGEGGGRAASSAVQAAAQAQYQQATQPQTYAQQQQAFVSNYMAAHANDPPAMDSAIVQNTGGLTPATINYLNVLARTQNTGPVDNGTYMQNNLDLYNAELELKKENAALQPQYEQQWRDYQRAVASKLLAQNNGTANQNSMGSQIAVQVLAGQGGIMANGGQYGFAPGNQAANQLIEMKAQGIPVDNNVLKAAISQDVIWNATGDPYSTRGINPIAYNSMGIAGGTYTANYDPYAYGASAFNDDGTYNLAAWGNYYEPGNVYDIRTQLNKMAVDDQRRLESLNNKNPLGSFIGGGPTVVNVIPGYVDPPSPTYTPGPYDGPTYPSPGGPDDPNNPGWLPNIDNVPGFNDNWKWDPNEGWVPIPDPAPVESVPGGMDDQEIRDSLFRSMIDSQANALRAQGRNAEADALLRRTAGTNWNTGALGQTGGAGDILNNLINMWGDSQYGNNLF